MSQSAREVLQALKPVQGFAEQVTRLIGVAHEAIRLEESLATTRRTLESLRTELAQARASQATLLAEAKDLSTRLESEREAHLKALQGRTV